MDDSPSEPTRTGDPQTTDPKISGADEVAAEGQASPVRTTDVPSTSSIAAASATTSPAAGSESVQEFTFDPWADGPRPPDLQPRLEEVAKITDPVLRQQVEANVRLKTQREVAAFTDRQRAAKAQAKAVIDQGGDLGSVPAKLLLQIDVPGRQALRDYVAASASPATDPVTYYHLKNRALDDPVGFQAVDITNHMSRLKPADYQELQQLQSSLKNNQPPADLPLQQAYKANTDRLLQQLGLPTEQIASPDLAANDNTAGSRKAALLRQAIDRHVAATEIATGRRMTPAEHLGMAAEVSSGFQRSSTDQQKSIVADISAPEAKGTVVGDGANDSAMLPGKLDLPVAAPNVVDFNGDHTATPNALQRMASSDGPPSYAECLDICSHMILPTLTNDGMPFYQCVLACMSGGKSGFAAWDKHF